MERMIVIIRCTPGMPQVSDCHCYYCYNTQGRQTRCTVGTNVQSKEKMGVRAGAMEAGALSDDGNATAVFLGCASVCGLRQVCI